MAVVLNIALLVIEGEKISPQLSMSLFIKIFHHTAIGMQLMRQAIARGRLLASDALGAMQKTISSDFALFYFIFIYFGDNL